MAGGTICSTSLVDGRKAGPQHRKQFAAEVAEVTGASKQDINRSIRRARELGPDIHRVVGTSLDKGVELDVFRNRQVKTHCPSWHQRQDREPAPHILDRGNLT